VPPRVSVFSVQSRLAGRIKALENACDSDGRSLIDPFIHLPSRAVYPDYYDMITDPISLSQIKKKASDGAYASLETFYPDVESLCSNALTYNREDSLIHQDAQRLLHICHRWRDQKPLHLSTEDETDSDSDDDGEEEEEILGFEKSKGLGLGLVEPKNNHEHNVLHIPFDDNNQIKDTSSNQEESVDDSSNLSPFSESEEDSDEDLVPLVSLSTYRTPLTSPSYVSAKSKGSSKRKR